MPIIFVMFAAAALAGMLTQSPALRAQTPRMITAAYHFANHWLRILMGISIAWPTILILVALIEGSRTVVLVLTFFPIAAAIYAAIVIPPAIWFAPTIVNSILGTTGKVTTGLVGVLPKRLRGGAIQTPKLPTVRQLLWPVAAGLIGNCLLGLFLYWVPIAKDRELMFILLLVLIPFALLSVFGKAKKLRGLMIFASAVLVLIFFLGGRGEAQKKVESKASKLTNLISAAINDSGRSGNGEQTFEINPITPTPQTFEDRPCGEDEGHPGNAMAGTRYQIGQSFAFRLHEGCFSKLVPPDYDKWRFIVDGATTDGQWIAFRCGSRLVPPVSIDSDFDARCGGPASYEGSNGVIIKFTKIGI